MLCTFTDHATARGVWALATGAARLVSMWPLTPHSRWGAMRCRHRIRRATRRMRQRRGRTGTGPWSVGPHPPARARAGTCTLRHHSQTSAHTQTEHRDTDLLSGVVRHGPRVGTQERSRPPPSGVVRHGPRMGTQERSRPPPVRARPCAVARTVSSSRRPCHRHRRRRRGWPSPPD